MTIIIPSFLDFVLFTIALILTVYISFNWVRYTER